MWECGLVPFFPPSDSDLCFVSSALFSPVRLERDLRCLQSLASEFDNLFLFSFTKPQEEMESFFSSCKEFLPL